METEAKKPEAHGGSGAVQPDLSWSNIGIHLKTVIGGTMLLGNDELLEFIADIAEHVKDDAVFRKWVKKLAACRSKSVEWVYPPGEKGWMGKAGEELDELLKKKAEVEKTEKSKDTPLGASTDAVAT